MAAELSMKKSCITLVPGNLFLIFSVNISQGCNEPDVMSIV